MMHNFGRRIHVNFPSGPADATAEIGFFEIEEEFFVETADLIKQSTADEKSRTRNDVHLTRLFFVPIT